MTVLKLSKKAHVNLGQYCNKSTSAGCCVMEKEQQSSTFASCNKTTTAGCCVMEKEQQNSTFAS
jgi:hypothetical protein